MADTKKYYHNLDVDNNKVVNLLLNPLTTAQRLAVGTLLTPVEQGYVCYDTTLNQQFFWNGTTWVTSVPPTTWGSITGSITSQTDLTAYLAANYYPLSSNPANYLTSAAANLLYYPLSSNPAGYLTSYTETDPVFSAWLATPPNISTFNNDAGYITTESDPAFSSWLSTPPNISTFINDSGYLSSVPTLQQVCTSGYTYDATVNPITLTQGTNLYNYLSNSGYQVIYAINPNFTYEGNFSYSKCEIFTTNAATAIVEGIQIMADKIKMYTGLGGANQLFLRFNNSASTVRSIYFPNGNGTLPLTVNGQSANSSGAITIPVGTGTVTGVTASSPLASSGGTAPNITIQQASGSQAGFLSSTDWTTFNSKQNAISLTTTGTSGAATFIANTLNIPQYQAAGTYVTSVGATGPITSSGGTTPTISTSMSTNRLIGRTTASTGVMEEISVGTGLTLSSGTLSSNVTGVAKGTAAGTDTYTTTISGVTAYNDGDAYLIRFTNGNTSAATLNINGLGAVNLYRNNDGLLIGGDIFDGAEMLCIYNSGTTGFQLIGTSPNTLYGYVTNADSVTITKGQVVYAFGGQGDRMTVKLASNTADATSAKTVGVVLSTSIAANQKGLIILQGLLSGLNILPTSTYNDGDSVYLGATAGSITNVKPYAPNHLVYVATVTTASNGSAGRMYVKIQNGYELDELHDVQAQNPALKDTLWYDSGVTPGQWKTASIPTILGYTPQAQLNGTGFVKASGTTISYDNSTYFVLPSLTSGSVLFSNGTTIAQNNSNFFWDNTNNRLGIGTNAPSTALNIVGATQTGSSAVGTMNLSQTWNTTGTVDAFVIDVTNTASNSNSQLAVFRTNGNRIFGIDTAGQLNIGHASNASQLYCASATGGYGSPNNPNLGFYNITSTNNSAFGSFGFSGSNITGTGGTFNLMHFNRTFAPTSGTAVYNIINAISTINQTGGANGITRGIYLNPTLTSAADWRAIETTAGQLRMTDTYGAGSGSLARSLIDLSQTWNTTGTPTAIKLNVTNTASNASSLLMDLQAGGTSRFSVAPDARITTQTSLGALGDSVRTGNYYLNAIRLLYTSSTRAVIDGSSLFGSTGNVLSYTGIANNTSGIGYIHNFSGSLNPTSGTGALRALGITPTINQTGGANGVSHGLYIEPTLTAAADFRAIETTNGRVVITDTSSYVSGGTNNPVVDINATFNNAATVGRALRVNVTNTASQPDARIADFQVGGSTVFRFGVGGAVFSGPFSVDSTNSSITATRGGNNGGSNFLFSGSIFGGLAITATNASWNVFTSTLSLTSATGNTTLTGFNFAPTINQTGSANGITRGLYVQPTLTSAADFRGIEVTNGSIVLPYTGQSATYPIKTSDYLVNCTSGTFTATLPTAVGCTGKIYIIKNSGAGAITVATTSSQTIDGATTYSLGTQYKYVQVVSDGANWIITGNN